MQRVFRIIWMIIILYFSVVVIAQEDSADTPFKLETMIAGINGDAGAITFHDGSYHMFANIYDSLASPVEIHYFVSDNAIDWEQVSTEALFSVEAYTAIVSDVVVTDDGTWMLYFSTVQNEGDTSPSTIGLAQADSPESEWSIIDEALISPDADSWDSAFTFAPEIVLIDTGYAMYYSGGIAENDLAIGYATSEDGITWTKQAEPQLTTLGNFLIRFQSQRVWQSEITETLLDYFIVFQSGTGLDESTGGMVRYGRSEDGLNWTLDTEQQAINLAEIGGDSVGRTEVLEVNGAIYLYLSVEVDGTYQVYLASYNDIQNYARIIDIANANNASDIGITLPPLENYTIHIRKENSDNSIALDEGQFVVTNRLDETGIYIRLTEDLVDADGDLITEGVPYTIEVLETISGSVIVSENITLQNETTVRTVIAGLDAAAGGIDVDADGNIYFADFGEQGRTQGVTVYHITPDGTVTPYLERNGLLTATGNVFDVDGNFYQSSFRGNLILQLTPDGEVTPFANSNMSGPVGITVDETGQFYVANCQSNNVAIITPDGESSIFPASTALLNCANGITLDEENNIYIANYGNGDVIKITPDGEASRLATLPGNNNGHIFYRDGLLYTVARSAHQVYSITLDGEVTLIAGSGERGNSDGEALNATFSLPNDLIFSHDGSELYINEGDALTTGRNHPAFVRAIVFAR